MTSCGGGGISTDGVNVDDIHSNDVEPVGVFEPSRTTTATEWNVQSPHIYDLCDETDDDDGSKSRSTTTSCYVPKDDDDSTIADLDESPQPQEHQVTKTAEVHKNRPRQEQIPASESDPNDNTSYTDNDVLCRCGGTYNNHPGNVRYLAIMKKYRTEYQKCSSRPERGAMIHRAIKEIESNGARFLTLRYKNDNTKIWVECDAVQKENRLLSWLKRNNSLEDEENENRPSVADSCDEQTTVSDKNVAGVVTPSIVNALGGSIEDDSNPRTSPPNQEAVVARMPLASATCSSEDVEPQKTLRQFIQDFIQRLEKRERDIPSHQRNCWESYSFLRYLNSCFNMHFVDEVLGDESEGVNQSANLLTRETILFLWNLLTAEPQPVGKVKGTNHSSDSNENVEPQKTLRRYIADYIQRERERDIPSHQRNCREPYSFLRYLNSCFNMTVVDEVLGDESAGVINQGVNLRTRETILFLWNLLTTEPKPVARAKGTNHSSDSDGNGDPPNPNNKKNSASSFPVLSSGGPASKGDTLGMHTPNKRDAAEILLPCKGGAMEAEAGEPTSRKRKILNGTAEKGLVGNTTKMQRVQIEPRVTIPALNKEPQRSSPIPQSSAATTATTYPRSPRLSPVLSAPTIGATATAATPSTQPEWELLLEERSNKLSEDDRLRVRQFFENGFNPTPNQSSNMYKMKLHEAKVIDEETGEPMKEKYYLELNYLTLRANVTKKIKRY